MSEININRSSISLRRIQIYLSIFSGGFLFIISIFNIVNSILKGNTLIEIIKNPSVFFNVISCFISFFTIIDLKKYNNIQRFLQLLLFYIAILLCIIINPIGSLVEVILFLFCIILGILYGFYKNRFWEKILINALFFIIVIIIKSFIEKSILMAFNSLFAFFYFFVLSWIFFKEIIDEYVKENNENNIYTNIGKEVAGIVHNLKSPLTAISGYAQLIETISNDKEVKEFIKSQEIVICSINDQLSACLSLVRLSASEKEILCSLKEIIYNVVYLFNANMNFKQKVKINFRKIEDCYIFIKPSKLIQIFQNLIQNSFESNDKDSCIIDISIKKIDEFVQFSITDNGPGISICKSCNVDNCISCDNFKIGKSTKDKGTGIGIVFVRDIILSIGGKFKIFSYSGFTEITIHFPIVKK